MGIKTILTAKHDAYILYTQSRNQSNEMEWIVSKIDGSVVGPLRGLAVPTSAGGRGDTFYATQLGVARFVRGTGLSAYVGKRPSAASFSSGFFRIAPNDRDLAAAERGRGK